MATALNQAIPASLIKSYKTILTVPQKATITKIRISLNNSVRQAQKTPAEKATLRAQKAAALWLTQQWNPEFKSSFYASRLFELQTQSYNPLYWHDIPASIDRTEWGTPFIQNYEKPVNGLYADPLRLQTNCVFTEWSKTYPTPKDSGNSNQPAPGWEGRVIDHIWRDLWFAQRRLVFNLPVEVTYHDKRPVLMSLNSTVNAVATFRANSSWFARCLYPVFSHEGNTPNPIKNYLATMWRKTDKYPMALVNTDSQYYAATNNLNILLSARSYKGFYRVLSANRLTVLVTTPPSRGVYFARNDHVQVEHHETLNIIMGKTRDG